MSRGSDKTVTVKQVYIEKKQSPRLKVLQNIIDKVPMKIKLGSKIASQRQSYQKQKLKQLARHDMYATTKPGDHFSPQNMADRRIYLPEISASHDFGAANRNPFSTLTQNNTMNNTSSTFESRQEREDSKFRNTDIDMLTES